MLINENCIKIVHLLYRNRTLFIHVQENSHENQCISLLARCCQLATVLN